MIPVDCDEPCSVVSRRRRDARHLFYNLTAVEDWTSGAGHDRKEVGQHLARVVAERVEVPSSRWIIVAD